VIHDLPDVREDLLITRFHPETDTRVEQLIIDLKAAGHRVVCGTNTFEKHYRHHLERGGYEVFDAVYASHIIGLAKSSEAFFQHILQQEGWRARDVFFIDDTADNVAAAAGMGMHAFLYESFPPLPAWLAGHGMRTAG
jgi:putative hydrolase of the HAD superfamily